MTGLADIDRDLALRLRIEALFADYVHCIDDDRLEAWPDFFTAAGRYRIITRENYDRDLPACLVYCSGRGMLKDRISAMRTANIFEPHTYCHAISAIKPVETTAAGIRVRSNFTVTRTMANGDMTVFACGRCFDELVDDRGTLRFASRDVVLDSRQIHTLLVIPI